MIGIVWCLLVMRANKEVNISMEDKRQGQHDLRQQVIQPLSRIKHDHSQSAGSKVTMIGNKDPVLFFSNDSYAGVQGNTL